jgi:hypothetical protein
VEAEWLDCRFRLSICDNHVLCTRVDLLSAVKMEAICFSETSVNVIVLHGAVYQTIELQSTDVKLCKGEV